MVGRGGTEILAPGTRAAPPTSAPTPMNASVRWKLRARAVGRLEHPSTHELGFCDLYGQAAAPPAVWGKCVP
jgi:hypothetical protein